MIKILAIGKIKDRFLTSLIEHYTKQMKNELLIQEITTITDKLSDSINILKFLNPNDYVIVLTVEGNLLSTMNFSKKLDALQTQGKQIIFIIGGAEGMCKEVKKRANYLLSLTPMTLPHQLARLILVEQIYRFKMIIKNHPYHK